MLPDHYIYASLIVIGLLLQGIASDSSRPFLKHYETLSYDRTKLLQSHQRSKRASNEEKTLTLHLAAYSRKFALILKRDTSAFADDFTVMSHDQPLPVDISFLYTGKLREPLHAVIGLELLYAVIGLEPLYAVIGLEPLYAVIGLEPLYAIAGFLMAVNAIFEPMNFNGIKYINFKVKVLNIMQEEKPNDPLNSPYIGIEKLLMLHSTSNWNHVCLSYLLTNRDYSGTLGLAWIGKPGNAGGICSKFTKMANSTEKASLNTGVVTIQKYGQYLPQRVIHITLAHELGHSLGSPHDGDKECANFAVSSPYGNYLMYPRAVDGNQYNNDKFSPCSIHYISFLLKIKKDQCFVESDRPTCGNQIVEAGEQCDVGLNDNDTCCYSANASEGLQCTLKPGKQCSPSQGQCCSQLCELKPKGERCREETECSFENFCTGESAKCPNSTAKENYTLCHYGTRICLNGVCSQSVCVKFGLEQCDCTTENMYEKCHLCCQKPGDASSCTNTKSAELSHLFNRAVLVLPPGAPCGQRQGYCDKFHICRFVDADGPIARLKNSFLSVIEWDPAEWMKTRWWAILLIILVLSALMAGTILIFGRTLDSNKAATKQKSSQKVKQERPRTRRREVVYWEKEEFQVTAAYGLSETRM
ncbi:disintegrin and metalloproteinase domain-containing protein 10-like [Pyxicephalus adspersus]|uniref:disintegrin and metalloproteinase domain-containing protein 10-like n=1 Tax=Pyxicephalus adspersus TaxID=30357 RepID=UPI003B59A52C